MDESALLERARTAAETELTRLGSEKALLAATRASLDAETVLGVLAASLEAAAERLGTWAGKTGSADLADALADGAVRLEALREDLEGADADAAPESTWLGERLADPGTDVGRAAAGLVGVPLVLDHLCLQAVSFFVNEAETERADAVRAVRDGVADLRDAHLGTVAERATDAGEGGTAVDGAAAVASAAYEEYVERLDAMGFDPKPIC